MMRLNLCILAMALTCLRVAAAGLTEEQTKGLDTLLQSTVKALTAGDPALWSLCSTQGSAIIFSTGDKLFTTSRPKLKNDADLAAKLRWPAGVTEDPQKRQLAACGDFIVGRLGFVGQPAADGKTPRWDLTLSAVQDGENATWRFVSLCIAPVPEMPDAAGVEGVKVLLGSWEKALTEGNTAALQPHLNEDPLCLAVYTPDGQPWYFTSRDYFISTLNGLVQMGTATKSTLQEMDVRASGQVATAVGRWHIEFPVFEPLNAIFCATFIKPADSWLMVSLCAAPGDKGAGH